MNAILEGINSAGRTFVEFAGPMLVQSSVLIVILLIGDFLLRRKVRAVLRYWLWMLVLVKLVLPISLATPVSLGQWFGGQLEYVQAEHTPAVVSPRSIPRPEEMEQEFESVEGGATEVSGERLTPLPVTEFEPAVTVAAPEVVAITPVTWEGWLFLGWLAGVAAMGLLLVQRAIFVMGLVAQAKGVNGLMGDTLKYCCGRMGVKGEIGLKVSANATSPAVCGLFRPVILVPQDLGPNLGAGGLRVVLMHELAHIRRGDLWVNLVQTVLQIVYFYNPLLWAANAVIRRVREQAVDEAVQVAMGEKAGEYPETLVSVAKLAFERPALSLRLIGVVESKSTLQSRVRRMLERPLPKSAKLGFLGLAMILVVGAILLPMAKGMSGPPEFVIKGRVTAAETGQPIAGAKVGDIEKYAEGKQFTTTDSDGNYSYLTWYEEHGIKAEAAGYKSEHKGLYTKLFGSEKEKVIDFELTPKKTAVEVEGGETERVESKSVESEMTLILGWNGEEVKVPSPIVLPRTITEKEEFKLWKEWKGPSGDLTIYDTTGYKYVLRPYGFKRDMESGFRELMYNVYRYRPDGVLEADTVYVDSIITASEWQSYDANGRKTVQIVNRLRGTDCMKEVRFYNTEGIKTKEWHVSEFDVVYAEMLYDPNGNSHFSHYLKDSIHSPYSHQTFTTTLPNGVTVELVGVCEHTSEGKQWWRPDGNVLEQVPWVVEIPQDSYYGLIIRLGGNIDLDPILYDEPICVPKRAGPWSRRRVYDKLGNRIKDLFAIVIPIKPDQKTESLKVGFETEDWKEADKEFVLRTYEFERNGLTSISVASRNREALRVLAIDINGKDYIGKRSVTRRVPLMDAYICHHRTYEFSLPRNEIKEFQFQTCPHQWVEFKNISLKPDFKTDVRVEVEEPAVVVEANGPWWGISTDEANIPITVREVRHPEGSVFYKKFNEDYLNELVAKSFDVSIGSITKSSSGKGSGPQQTHKKMVFKTPFPYEGIERRRRLILHQDILRESVYEDIQNTLGALAGGSGAGELQQIFYNTDSATGSINIHYSRDDFEKDILQITFTIQEVFAKQKPAIGVEGGGESQEMAVFESYFPYDAEAGRKLTGWWENKDSTYLDDDSFFELFRKGLRACTIKYRGNFPMQHIGGEYIQRREPDEPRAVDIVYHASFSPEFKYYAVYSGLSVANPKSEKVLRRLVDIAMEPHQLGRIIWGVKRSRQEDEFAALLEPYLGSSDSEKSERADVVIKALRGEIDADKWEREWNQQQKTDIRVEGGDAGIIQASELGAAAEVSAEKGLQELIDAAKKGGTVIVPEGVYTEPVRISKSLKLKGQSLKGSVFEVTANEPAIFVDAKGKGRVTIEGLTIKWQLATSDKGIEHPFAVAVKDTKAEIKRCNFVPLGNAKRSPVAIRAMGFSNLNIESCRFEGFEYVVCYGEGTEGVMSDSLIMDCGHQGVILYSGAKAKILRNVITGSRYHAVRSTGGTLDVRDNLLINNANRGIYLGNKSARGVIANNIIMGNGTGISGFARSRVRIQNNIIADSSYAGISMRDSCSLSIRNNILQGNAKGCILHKEGSKNANKVFRNLFWENEVDVENFAKPAVSISAEPGFADPENGDFSLKAGAALEHKQGLSDPNVFKVLWKRWENRDDKDEPFNVPDAKTDSK